MIVYSHCSVACTLSVYGCTILNIDIGFKPVCTNMYGSFHSKTTNFSATTSENFYFFTGCCL
ncbi:hypothetical protein GHT06_015167 [Daphnia sinensis]|uniref:Uncharacterized protein n=1 Tax=Daphnia sinensis TaxID=1820382 RepID=A0AAD5PUF0_9CRUS|nr:hypothetical protein GHT06_015167 [Daphnia sinensis]